MSTQTWRTVPHKYVVILVVDHACGHEGRYLYGLEGTARRDVGTQQAPKCLHCHNASEIERLTALIAERKNLTPARLAPISKVTP